MNSSTEIINMSKLKIIIDNFDHLKKQSWSEKDASIQLLSLKKIYRSAKKNKGLYKTEYKFAQGRYEGRKFVKSIGLQNLTKEFRNTIGDEYYDYDIVNCFPVLLLNYCLEKSYPCNELAKYKELRNKYIEEHSFNVKDVVNQLIHCGLESYNNIDDKPEFIIKLKNEITAIHSLIKTDRKEEFQLIKKKNAMGTFISNILTEIESKILDGMISFLNQNSISVKNIVLVFDGFMIPKTAMDELQFENLQNFVANKYNVNVIRKPMTTLNLSGYKETIEKPENDFDTTKVFLEWLEINDYKIIKTAISSTSNDIFFYNKANGLYSNNINGIRGILQYCDVINDKYRFDTSYRNRILFELKNDDNLLPPTDDDFYLTQRQSTLGKIAFNNGIYDFYEKKLLQFSPDYIFLSKLSMDYDNDYDMNYEQEIHQKIFLDIFGTESESLYVKEILARALAGETNDKKMYFITGDGNSGKGVLSDLIKKAFGAFSGSFNANVFAVKKTDGDQAKNLSWIVPLINKRIVFSNEIKMKQTLDGEFMKTISGGDELTARQNHKDESSYAPQFTTFLFANDLPKIETADEISRRERFHYISTKYSYFSGAKYESNKHRDNIKLADTTIKTHYIHRSEIYKTFVYMILNAFKPHRPDPPQAVIDESDEWEAENNETQIIDLFAQGDINVDYITVKDAYKIIENEGITTSHKNIKKILLREGYKYSQKRVNNQTAKVIFGLKKLTTEYEYDDECML